MEEKYVVEQIRYEMPTIAEYIWFDWGQNLMAKYVAWVVNRKNKRYKRRLNNDRFFSSPKYLWKL